MTDPIDELLSEFAGVTAGARPPRPALHGRRSYVFARAFAGALVVVLVAAVALVVLATRAPQGPAASSAVSRSGDFQLTLTTDGTQYTSTQAIHAVAELAYVGSSPSVEISSLKPGPIGFGVRQVSGSINAEPGWFLQCMQVDLTRGQPFRQPFTKSGGWNDSDPNRNFYAWFAADPQLHLPSGTWEIYAKVDAGPNGGNCQGEIELQASVTITVLPGSPIPIPSLPTPFPPGVATPPPVPLSTPAASSAWLACSAVVGSIGFLGGQPVLVQALDVSREQLANYIYVYNADLYLDTAWRYPGTTTACWFDGDLYTEEPGPPHDTSAARVLVIVDAGQAQLVAVARTDPSLLPLIDPAAVPPQTGATPSPATPSPSPTGLVQVPGVLALDPQPWAPDGQHLMVVNARDLEEVVDATGMNPVTIPAYSNDAGWIDSSTIVALVRDSQTTLTGHVSLYDVSGRVTAQIDGDFEEVVASPGNDLFVAVAAGGQSYKVWDKGVLSDWRQGNPLSWSADGSELALLTEKETAAGQDGGPEGPLTIVDRARNTAAQILDWFGEEYGNDYLFSSDGRYLAGCLSDSLDQRPTIIRAIDLASGTVSGPIGTGCVWNGIGWGPADKLYVSDLVSPQVWTPESGATDLGLSRTTFVAPALNGSLAIWSDGGSSLKLRIADQNQTRHFQGFQFVRWSPDGQKIAFLTQATDPMAGDVLAILTP